jgi:hypothetical protein
MDMVELQHDRQMPIVGSKTVVDKREDGNDSVDDKLSSGAFSCYQKIHMTHFSFS